MSIFHHRNHLYHSGDDFEAAQGRQGERVVANATEPRPASEIPAGKTFRLPGEDVKRVRDVRREQGQAGRHFEESEVLSMSLRLWGIVPVKYREQVVREFVDSKLGSLAQAG